MPPKPLMNPALDLNEESVTLRVPGDLISTNAGELRKEVSSLLETAGGAPRKWDTFILDLSAAKMVDSVGLNLVVSLFKRVQVRGAKMQVNYSSPNILRTFTFTRLDKLVKLVKV